MNRETDLFWLVDVEAEQNDFRNLLNEHRKSNKFTDVELQIVDKQFPAHRNVLSLYSPVLEAAISDQWSTTKICSISDEYVDPEIMEDLLSFLYTGSIKLTPDNAHSICMAAHFLQIGSLLQPCSKFLCELISVENMLTLFLFSINFQLDKLHKNCLKFIIANCEEVFQDPETLKLKYENFKTIIIGLKSRSWQSMLREHTFDFIVRWTEVNISERLEHLPILLENIPLDALPTEFLEETVSTHPLVKDGFSCSAVLSKAISNNQNISQETNENFVVIGGYTNTEKYCFDKLSKSMFCYDSTEKSWKQLPDISENKSLFAATVINGQNIIISGGKVSSSESTDKVEMFDWSTQTWMNMPPMPFGLGNHVMAELNGILYVAGEQEHYKNKKFIRREDKMLCYSFESKQWSDCKKPNYAGWYSQLIPYKDHLYAIGTYHFEKYDPAQNQWTVLTPSNIKFCHLAVTLHQDRFYVCSENVKSSVSTFQVYDPETNHWTSLPAPAVESYTSLLGKSEIC